MVGAGTLVTCSWQYIPSPMTNVFIRDTSDQLNYNLVPTMGVNEGMYLLDDTVGWLGEDKLFVYINKTEKRHMSMYYCFVGASRLGVRSNWFELIVNGKNVLHYGILLRCCLIKTRIRSVWQ